MHRELNNQSAKGSLPNQIQVSSKSTFTIQLGIRTYNFIKILINYNITHGLQVL